MTLEQVEKMALELSAGDREMLAATLWSSLESPSNGDLPANWRDVVLRRRDDFDAGREQGIPADQVFDQVRKELGWR